MSLRLCDYAVRILLHNNKKFKKIHRKGNKKNLSLSLSSHWTLRPLVTLRDNRACLCHKSESMGINCKSQTTSDGLLLTNIYTCTKFGKFFTTICRISEISHYSPYNTQSGHFPRRALRGTGSVRRLIVLTNDQRSGRTRINQF